VSVRVRGPIVHSLQGCFSENWAGETGELFAGPGRLPALKPAGELPMHLAYAKPEGSAPGREDPPPHADLPRPRAHLDPEPLLHPDPDAIDAFASAVKRGVDVRVLMPSDQRLGQPDGAARRPPQLRALMRSGVQLFEYPHTLLHQKVMTVDGIYSVVGSSNFDDRSFETNDEVTLGILDAKTR
jgi:cardiolipin synthase